MTTINIFDTFSAMREAGLTKQERSLLTLTRVLMVLFFMGTVLFIVLPDWILNYLSDLGNVIFNFKPPQTSLGAERFWLVLAIAFTSTLTYVCFITQSDFLRNIEYVKVIVFSKFVSTVGFIICFLKFDFRFFYLTGAVIDGVIFFVTLFYYHAARKSRSA